MSSAADKAQDLSEEVMLSQWQHRAKTEPSDQAWGLTALVVVSPHSLHVKRTRCVLRGWCAAGVTSASSTCNDRERLQDKTC